jgi:hypothetical protein
MAGSSLLQGGHQDAKKLSRYSVLSVWWREKVPPSNDSNSKTGESNPTFGPVVDTSTGGGINIPEKPVQAAERNIREKTRKLVVFKFDRFISRVYIEVEN